MPLKDLNDVKEELRDLVFSGHKDQAIRLLQDKYGVTLAEAEKLLLHALRESINPADLIKRVFGFAIGYKKAMFKILAFVMGLIGIPVLLMAVGVYVYTSYQIDQSDKIMGTVVELEANSTYNEPTRYTPVIAYDVNGDEHSIRAGVFSSTSEFALGDTVALYVSRENPESVIIDTFTQRWLMIVVIGIIGFSFTSSMIVLRLYSRRI